jgi:hypothetical protein
MTVFYRAVFPVLWIAIFGLGTVLLWVGDFDQATAPPLEMKVIFLVGWVVGSAFVYWFTRRLRSVWLENDELVVGDLGRSESFPLSSVVQITESRFTNPKTIKILLQHPSGGIGEITFLAPAKLQVPFTDHPVVRMLRARVDEARERAARLPAAAFPRA